MIKLINWQILIPLLLLGFILLALAKKSSNYRYLFRNTILSKSKKYELAPILRGRVYYPRYFYIPSLKQYLVYSNVDESGYFRKHETKSKSDGDSYAILDEEGNIIMRFDTSLRFSHRSGCFYGSSTYIPLLETGKKDPQRYHQIYNQDLDMGKRDFEKLFIQLYTSSEYVEYINLRVSNDDVHQAGIIFKRNDKVEILLSGLRDSRMICYSQENRRTNNLEDYYLPDIQNKETFPQSQPAIEMIRLETTNLNPFGHWRICFNREFNIERYKNYDSSGFQGVGMFGFIPIFVFGESSGTAYVRFKVKGETFRIKILDVYKVSFMPYYNLGLRTFQLPKNSKIKKSLVFMESLQNCGSNRMGGGVFVVRQSMNTNPSADIPSDMTEKQFNKLPANLQWEILNPVNENYPNKKISRK